MHMDIRAYNRTAWNKQVASGNQWTVPVSADMIAAARRGGGSRGGKRAFLNLIRSLRVGWDAAVTPDGPRGPRYQVQDGIISLAAASGAPIVPVSYASSLRFVFKGSWDHFRLPLPCSRIKLVFGSPIRVGRDVKSQTRPGLREELRRKLRQADREAEEVIGG